MFENLLMDRIYKIYPNTHCEQQSYSILRIIRLCSSYNHPPIVTININNLFKDNFKEDSIFAFQVDAYMESFLFVAISQLFDRSILTIEMKRHVTGYVPSTVKVILKCNIRGCIYIEMIHLMLHIRFQKGINGKHKVTFCGSKLRYG